MKRALGVAVLAFAFAGCRGTVPRASGGPEQGISAVVIGGRILGPNGKALPGRMVINFESEGGRQAQVYRLPVKPGAVLLYHIEPGKYHFAPTRSLFGDHLPFLRVRIEGRAHPVEFPREILRKPAVGVRPRKIVPLGLLEARWTPELPGRPSELKVALDDSLAARRGLVESLISDMMNPDAPQTLRDNLVSWTHSLEAALVDLSSEAERAPLFKPSP